MMLCLQVMEALILGPCLSPEGAWFAAPQAVPKTPPLLGCNSKLPEGTRELRGDLDGDLVPSLTISSLNTFSHYKYTQLKNILQTQAQNKAHNVYSPFRLNGLRALKKKFQRRHSSGNWALQQPVSSLGGQGNRQVLPQDCRQ